MFNIAKSATNSPNRAKADCNNTPLETKKLLGTHTRIFNNPNKEGNRVDADESETEALINPIDRAEPDESRDGGNGDDTDGDCGNGDDGNGDSGNEDSGNEDGGADGGSEWLQILFI